MEKLVVVRERGFANEYEIYSYEKKTEAERILENERLSNFNFKYEFLKAAELIDYYDDICDACDSHYSAKNIDSNARFEYAKKTVCTFDFAADYFRDIKELTGNDKNK